MVVVIMIETPIGVENAEKIASVPGIDVIFAASTDLANFSGHRQGDKEYEALVTRIHDVTLQHRIRLGGTSGLEGSPGIHLFPGSRRNPANPVRSTGEPCSARRRSGSDRRRYAALVSVVVA